MEYIAKIEYVNSNGSISSTSAVGMTSNGAGGYTSNAPSSSDGTLTNVSLTITKSNNKAFRIVFGNAYVKEYCINGVKYANNKKELIVFDTNNSVTINFAKLSEFSANYSISSIDTKIEVEYHKKSLLSFTRGSQNKADTEYPDFTPISQYGNLEIKDLDNLIVNLSKQHLLKENNTKVNIYCKDTNGTNQIAIYTKSQISYRYGEFSANFTMTDEIEDYSNVTIPKIPMYNDDYEELYNLLVSYSPNSSDFEPSQAFLTRIRATTTYFYSKDSMSLFDAWNDFCNATQTTLYIREDGKKVFKVWLS